MAFLLENVQVEYGPVAVREFPDHFLEHVRRYVFRFGLEVGQTVRNGVLTEDQRVFLPAAEVHQGLVHHYTPHPWPEGFFIAPEGAEGGENLDEGFLEHVLGLVFGRNVTETDGGEIPHMSVVQRLHCCGISTCGPADGAVSATSEDLHVKISVLSVPQWRKRVYFRSSDVSTSEDSALFWVFTPPVQ